MSFYFLGNIHFLVPEKFNVAVYGKGSGNFHRELRDCWLYHCDHQASEAVNFVPERPLYPYCASSKVSPVPVVPTALIGRDAEMAMLIRLVQEAAGGRGRSVLIEGEPGIGKSTLVRAALADAATGRLPGVLGRRRRAGAGAAAAAVPRRPAGTRALPESPAKHDRPAAARRAGRRSPRGRVGRAGRAVAGAHRRAVHRAAGRPGHRRSAVGRSGQHRAVGTAGPVGPAGAAAAGRDDAPGAPPR